LTLVIQLDSQKYFADFDSRQVIDFLLDGQRRSVREKNGSTLIDEVTLEVK
jgi:hypothetical protein